MNRTRFSIIFVRSSSSWCVNPRFSRKSCVWETVVGCLCSEFAIERTDHCINKGKLIVNAGHSNAVRSEDKGKTESFRRAQMEKLEQPPKYSQKCH